MCTRRCACRSARLSMMLACALSVKCSMCTTRLAKHEKKPRRSGPTPTRTARPRTPHTRATSNSSDFTSSAKLPAPAARRATLAADIFRLRSCFLSTARAPCRATVTRPPSPTPPSGSAPSAGSALVCSRHDHCVTPATRRPRGLGLSVVCRVTSTALRAHSARVRALPLGLAPCRCRPGCASLHA